ncbi:MAG: DUF4173 domain-containing protein [Defluviitaleaceae bacterium]|nr:DUF4173 domain-containing protein [Defluviitaleaceae bacterium]
MKEEEKLENKEDNPKITYTYVAKSKLLIPISLIFAILFEIVVIRIGIFERYLVFNSPRFYFEKSVSIWVLALLTFFVSFNYKRILQNKILVFLTVALILLNIWIFIIPDRGTRNNQYKLLTTLFVVPAVFMGYFVWFKNDYNLYNINGIVKNFFIGWVNSPFSHISDFFRIIKGWLSKRNSNLTKRILLGVLVSIFILIIILPLLLSADQVFMYYFANIFRDFNINVIIWRLVVISIITLLLFSFLFDTMFVPKTEIVKLQKWNMDEIIMFIVLSSIIFVYILFVMVQFVYLFARAGLPQGILFYQYARSGFAQTIAVCTINLVIMSICINFSKSTKLRNIFLSALVSLTLIKIISGAIRLFLYIDAFGMTWLRLISGWFLIYLFLIVSLGFIKIFKHKFPYYVVCALFLIVWYIVLGYLNPDSFIDWYNSSIQFN